MRGRGKVVAALFAALSVLGVSAVMAVPATAEVTTTITEDDVTEDVVDCADGTFCAEQVTTGAFHPWRIGKYGLPDTTVCLESRMNNAAFMTAITAAAANYNALPDLYVWARDAHGCDSVPATRKMVYVYYNGGADGRCAYNHITYNTQTHVLLTSEVRVNVYYTNVCASSASQREHLTTHEAGHGFGIQHTTATSVMNVSMQVQELTSVWDIPHLNQYYHD